MPPETSRYDTRLDIKFKSLEHIDEQAISDAITHPWFNQGLCTVNDSVIRLGVVQGEYHWHKHDKDDEFFYVVEGERTSTCGTGPSPSPHVSAS